MGSIEPLPNIFPGANSVGLTIAANSGKTGWPALFNRNRISGMKTGTNRARAFLKSIVICSQSASGVHSGSLDSTRVAPSSWLRTCFISALAAAIIGSTALMPGFSMDSRMTPIRFPWSDPV